MGNPDVVIFILDRVLLFVLGVPPPSFLSSIKGIKDPRQTHYPKAYTIIKPFNVNEFPISVDSPP